MTEEIVVPKMGESVSSGIIAEWLKSNGDVVAEGEEIFELETDKATLAVPTTAAGTLTQKAAEGDEVEVGQVVATIDTDGAAAADSSEDTATPKSSADDASEGDTKDAEGGTEDAEADRATGDDAAKAPSSDDSSSQSTDKPTQSQASAIPEDAKVSPSVRRIIEQYSLDYESIDASGPGGRITKEDALAALLAKAESSISESTTSGLATPSSTPTSSGNAADSGTPEFERKPMSNLRKRIAENLVQSKLESAHLTTFNEIDMSAVMSIRSAYRDEFEKKHGVRLGFMSFFVKACCVALKAYPQANAEIDGDDLIINHVQNIGVAVSTERGLIVPVIRNAGSKSFAQIEQEIISFATRAREKKIGLDELTGGTFSITNGGVFGSLLSTPIPTPRQAAILGMHSIQKRPVAIGDSVEIRPMMYVAVTYDHRIMDGREAVSFLVKIKDLIEDPNQMLIGM